MMIIYDAQTAEVKSTDSLAPKENSPSENSPAHGNAKIDVFRARGDIFGRTVYCYETYVASYISRAVFWENNMEIMRVLKDIGT